MDCDEDPIGSLRRAIFALQACASSEDSIHKTEICLDHLRSALKDCISHFEIDFQGKDEIDVLGHAASEAASVLTGYSNATSYGICLLDNDDIEDAENHASTMAEEANNWIKQHQQNSAN